MGRGPHRAGRVNSGPVLSVSFWDYAGVVLATAAARYPPGHTSRQPTWGISRPPGTPTLNCGGERSAAWGCSWAGGGDRASVIPDKPRPLASPGSPRARPSADPEAKKQSLLIQGSQGVEAKDRGRGCRWQQPSEKGERRRGPVQGRPSLGRWGTAGRTRNGSSQRPGDSARAVTASPGARGPRWPCVHTGPCTLSHCPEVVGNRRVWATITLGQFTGF